MQTPARRPSQMKVANDDLGIGGSFMTEVKQVGRMPSRQNLLNQSPDGSAFANRLNAGKGSEVQLSASPQPGNYTTQSVSPSSAA